MAGIFGGGKGSNTQVTKYTGLNIQTSSQGLCIPIGWGRFRAGTNIIDAVNFIATPVKSGGKGGKGGGGGKGGASSYKYSTALILSLCEGPIQDVTTVWSDQTTTTLAALNLTLFTGTAVQTPPAWMSSNFPSHAESYARTAYLFSSLYDLGSSPTVPQHNFEVDGYLSGSQNFAPSHLPDANFADIIQDFITNPQYGIDPNATYIDATSWANYKNYCQAQSLWASPYLNSQEQATSIITRWAQLSNSFIFWSGDQIKFVPLGDVNIIANTTTFLANVTPLFDLGPDDFVQATSSDEPLTVNRTDPTDGYNIVELDILSRPNSYNNTPIRAEDQVSLDLYGQLQSQIIQANEICDPGVANIMAELIKQRAVYIRNNYSFKLSYAYVLLEPGDLVTLTQDGIGLSRFPVRILTVEEDSDDILSLTAEEFPLGAGRAAAFTSQPSESTPPPEVLADPGNVNPPAIIEPSPVVTNGQPEVWIGLSGGPNWGGANVYISADNVNFGWIGVVNTPSQQGVLTAPLANHADPDNVNTLAIDTSESGAVVSTAVTAADADAFRTASLIDGEIVSYGTVTLTGPDQYSLTGLRRGVYNTSPASHTSGVQWTRIDPTVAFVYALPQQYVGIPLYFKFASFNQFGHAQQDVATVPSYPYTPTGVAFTIAPPTSATLVASRVVQADSTTILAMTLGWAASTGPMLGSYEVQFSRDGGVSWFTDNSVGATAVSYTLSPAVASTSYQARVRAVSQSGLAISSWLTSAVVNSGTLNIVVPSTPTGLSTTGGIGQIALTWNANAVGDAVLSYTLLRAPGPGGAFGSATTLAITSDLNYTDTGLSPGSVYTYFLIASNAAGSSGHTAGVDGTVLTQQNLWNPVVSLTDRRPNPNEELFLITLSYATGLPSGLTNSAGSCEVAFTNSAVFTLYKNGISIGTATIPSGTTGRNIATFSFLSNVSFAADDTFSFNAPTAQDPTGKGISFSFYGSR